MLYEKEIHKKSITSLQLHDDASGAESENYEQSVPPGTVFAATSPVAACICQDCI